MTAPGERGSAAGGAAVAALVVAVVAMMIVPLPTWLLDVLITLNIAVSVTLLLTSAYARDALAIASFPTLLVLTTLYRLALNVSTTRLILLRADAGRVVSAFGRVVVAGDYVVGAAVFLILTIVQYVVIARGAERVAEVAARFTLDAMPGKQLAIDGDLRAGLIDAEEARRRRQLLGREAQLYGALDGAMRFVKGDAVAGILILVISLVGGLVVGTLVRGVPLVEAARTYTLLTIGDGLVSQLPALLISTAAGLVVTRVASEEGSGADATVGSDILRQLLARPRSLAIVAALLVALGAVPGMPGIPFVVVAAPFALAALVLGGRQPASTATGPLEPEAHADLEVALDPALAASGLPADPSVGESGAAGVQRRTSGDAAAGGGSDGAALDAALEAAARALVDELGVPLPRVTRTVDPSLPPRGYAVRVRGVALAEGAIPDGRLLAAAPPARLAALGIEATATSHPGSGRPASWVAAAAAPALRSAGIALLGARDCVVAALDGTLRRHAHELLGFDETQRLVDALARHSPALVREVIPRRVDVGLLTDVLRRLVAEGVPIRDLRDVLEALAAAARTERDPATLTERVRAALHRHITQRLAPQRRRVDAVVLDPLVEEAVRGAIRPTQGGPVLALEPEIAADILAAMARALDASDGAAPSTLGALRTPHPVIVTAADLRRHVRRLLEGEHPEVAVVAWQELDPDVEVEPVARVVV